MLQRIRSSGVAAVFARRMLVATDASNKHQKRNLNVHEHVAMEILKAGGVAVPRFAVATSPEEALQKSQKLGANDFVVKAQVLTGGRGRGTFSSGLKGGVKLVYSPEEVCSTAKDMIGNHVCFYF